MKQIEKDKGQIFISAQLTQLEAIEQIVKLAKDSQLDEEFYKSTAPYITILSTAQDIDEVQAVLLSLLVEICASNRRATLCNIARYVGSASVGVIKYQSKIDNMASRHLLRKHSQNEYSVPSDVIKALTDNIKYERKPCKCKNVMDFFQRFQKIYQLKFVKEITYDLFIEELNQLYIENAHLEYVKELKKFGLNFEDEIILTFFCRSLAIKGEEVIALRHLYSFSETADDSDEMAFLFKEGEHQLLKKKLIEYNWDDGFREREYYRLTSLARKRLLKGFSISIGQHSEHDYMTYRSIVKKEMFYDDVVATQVAKLAGLLGRESYKQIKRRMKKSGMRCAFTCLLYGSPGTGKTESVLQLAQQTGRNIMQVNISEIKSMWVGESEKNIKAIFDRYREISCTSRVTPILLFNEADSIIGKRREGAVQAVDKMENSIQNIILQEMEILDGIMIATTNLEQNLDSAFERRFLYKIKFPVPSVNTRSQIWKSMIPELSESESLIMATKYDFSGGQIENIARRYAIDNVLHGASSNRIERLCSYSDGERIDNSSNRKIGFVI